MTHKFRHALAVFLAIAAWTSQAAAQTTSVQTTRSLVPAVFPRWDLGGGMGMLNISTDDSARPWQGWDQRFQYRADIGRYWTTHLKTDVAITVSNQWNDYEVITFPTTGPQSPLFAYTNVDRRLTTVAPSLTWQFRENALMHPYVGAGLQVGFLQEHRFRSADVFRPGTAPTVPPIDERTATAVARPFLAGGFKSYISRSVYVRTEGRVALKATGVGQVSLIAGIGFDF